MAKARVLLTGATGFLGPFALAELRRVADVATLARSDADFCVDVVDRSALLAAVAAAQPDLVLNLAALSRMAACEREPGRAAAINVTAPAELARRLGRRLLHVSTDLVFDGRGAPYSPRDATGPLSVYGQTKAEGEEAALTAGGRVVRIPLLFGPDAKGRGATAMIRTAIDAQRPVGLFTNEYRTPLHAADAARGLVDVLFSSGPVLTHLAGPERMSRWELGRRLCAVHGLPTDLLQPVECQDGLRPRDVSLVSHWRAPRDVDDMLRDS